MPFIPSIIFGLAISTTTVMPTPRETPYIPLSAWQAEKGDRFIADTERNMGYILHTEGTYTSMPIGSGQRATVHYLGKTYNAATPRRSWAATSITMQPKGAIFGKTGLFLRLYYEGERTSYGIHSTGNITEILGSDSRFASMGCILVNDNVLALLYETYLLNGEHLDVLTTRSIAEDAPQLQADF